MAEPRTYRLKLVWGDRQFEAEGDKEFVLEMLEKYGAPQSPSKLSPEPTVTELGPGNGGDLPGGNSAKPLSASEFMRGTQFKKHTDLVLAAAYFLEKYAGLPQFSPADINRVYYEAKIEPSNTSMMIIQNQKKGFLMEAKGAKAKGKKQYTVTASGEKYIETKLKKPQSDA